MLVRLYHPVIVPPLHNGTFTWDEFLCIGLIALALVVATFFVRGGEKPEGQNPPAGETGQTRDKPARQ
jgi:hypothetical protein